MPPKLDDNTVYLVDGSGYIFRSYFAIRPLHSKKGLPTNAVFGFTNMLLKLIKEHRPKYLGIAFDRKEPTFRHELYKDYKANRPLPPKDLVPQFDLIHQVVRAFNIKLLSMAGFEADDLIGTLAKRALLKKHSVVIVTGDKDLMQLVDDRTFLLDELRASRNGAEKFIDEAMVKEQLGVRPDQVIDLLALAGDASDNVPGVSGIGAKTAADLINEFGPLEKILEMTPLIKQKSRREKLIHGYKSALLSKELVTIDCHVPIECSIEDLKYQGIDRSKTHDLFWELDFHRLLKDESLFGTAPEDEAAPKPLDHSMVDRTKYRAITDETSLLDLMKELRKASHIAIDTETDGLDSTTANLVGISLAWGENLAAYIPLAHDREQVEQQLPLKMIQTPIREIITDPKKTIIAQNGKFDLKILLRHGFKEFVPGGDPMLASYLLYQDLERHNLDDLSLKYLAHKTISYEEVCGSKKNQIPFSQVPLKIATEYAAEDADITLRLNGILLEDLKRSSLLNVYQDLELPLEEVLARMEIKGVRIDREILKTAGQELKQRLTGLQEKAYGLCGTTFNMGSPKQVSEILFERLGLPTQKKTKTGFSTDSSVLEKLISHHPIIEVLLDYRLCSKLINTYIETLPHLINPDTGRIHTNYNQFVTATGRLSSSDPNLQNIPAKTKEGRRIRQAFIADEEHSLISLDYSQVELRILAFVSKDPVLLDSFHKDQDVHKRTASEIFDIPQDAVSNEQRNAAKTINFGILYGMGAHRLSQTLNISRKDANTYLETYFKKYAGVFRWKNEMLMKAKDEGEVRTLFGRKRLVPELTSNNAMERARAERIAINTPIQGTAADVIKKAMIDTHRYLSKYDDEAALIMQVHDELIIEARAELAQKIADDISEIMSQGHGLAIDLKVDYGIAHNWDEAH